MKEKLAFSVLYALLIIFLTNVNCITVTEDSENFTIAATTPVSIEKNDTTLSIELTSERDTQEAKIINDADDDDELPGSSTAATIHKIPPTLQNVKKVDAVANEKSQKSIKDIAKPAQMAQQLDDKLKKAIINSKQQSFKNLVDKTTGQLKDQIARPAEVQSDIAKELPPAQPTTKEFVPSPELSTFYNPNNNREHDHFQPVDHFMRPPAKDARFPFENREIGHNWHSGHRAPNKNNFHHHIHPNDVVPNLLQQHGMMRNTHVEFPHQHADRQINFQQHFHPSQQHDLRDHYNPRHSHHQIFAGSGERMVFPNDASPFSEGIKPNNWPPKMPELNKNERMKGSWKWVPDNVEENEDTEARFHAFNTNPVIYDSLRPHTVRDRPYSFESSDIFSQQTTPPTGPGAVNSWPTAEAYVSGEEMPTTGKSDESEKNHLDVKMLRSPSPWKKLIHVMTAAIPLGLIISALTPRIVYVHPNATAPTLQPPLSQQKPPPALPPTAPNQDSNSPYALRQRAIITPTHDINASLTEFMKFMETQYRERRGNVNGICEDRFFCEMALMGARPNADLMHRTMYKVAIETSETQAEQSGLGKIFEAIKRHDCNAFKCTRVS